jgi:hypothetical protein
LAPWSKSSANNARNVISGCSVNSGRVEAMTQTLTESAAHPAPPLVRDVPPATPRRGWRIQLTLALAVL